jgi:hypothetical protein
MAGTIMFMFLLFLESSKVRKHYKRKKEIDKRKKLKETTAISQSPIS